MRRPPRMPLKRSLCTQHCSAGSKIVATLFRRHHHLILSQLLSCTRSTSRTLERRLRAPLETSSSAARSSAGSPYPRASLTPVAAVDAPRGLQSWEDVRDRNHFWLDDFACIWRRISKPFSTSRVSRSRTIVDRFAVYKISFLELHSHEFTR